MKINSLAQAHLTDRQIATYLNRVRDKYRHGDASWYLYREMVWDYGGYSSDQIERLYAVLMSWGMNSRGAKLVSFERFLASIKKNRKIIESLSEQRIQKIDSFDNPAVLLPLKHLFKSLAIVPSGKPRFVSFSKTMHFLCPHLIAPMDRKYTLTFFRKNPASLPSKPERQFELFKMIMEDYRVFVAEHKLKGFMDKRWNLSLPKICDNIIIGRSLLRKKCKRPINRNF